MLTQTHYLGRPVRLQVSAPESLAYWAIQPGGTALIFVHGFDGSAERSWLDFPSLLQEHPDFAPYDLIFFAYRSLTQKAGISAKNVNTLLDTLHSRTASFVNKSLPRAAPARPDQFVYHRFVIVAHSLGALVTRLALLDAHRTGLPWAKKVDLVLFAPAHKGVTALETIPALLWGLPIALFTMPLPLGLLRNRYVVIPDLRTGSPTIQALERLTQQAIDRDDARYLIAKRIIFGENEGVVDTSTFCQDTPYVVLEGRDHVTVCKPISASPEPLQELVQCL